jgi:N-acetylmuramic acid 6-phosphate etherase
MSEKAEDRGHLSTEAIHPASEALDQLAISDAVELMIREDRTIADAVHAARAEIAAAIERIADCLKAGGRLFYVGAGTSGRLAMLDAAECPPTFQSNPDLVQGVIAGGEGALLRAIEGAEDSRKAAAGMIEARGIGPADIVFGITAGGTTPYVHSALATAKARGAATIFFACVSKAEVEDTADQSIRVLTGPELVSGSTRLKAGTATKLVLNMVSTLTMVQLGKVHGNLMIDVNTSGSQKLQDRGERLIQHLTAVSREEARALLEGASGSVKVAALMHLRTLTSDEARAQLNAADGHLRRALELTPPAPS